MNMEKSASPILDAVICEDERKVSTSEGGIHGPKVLDKFDSKLPGSFEAISCAETKPLVWGNASVEGQESEAVKGSGPPLPSVSKKASWANVVAIGGRNRDCKLPEVHKDVGNLT
ncbi:hypothetical protein U1Q18_036384 [Sarracenia purpurea var. burkii]